MDRRRKRPPLDFWLWLAVIGAVAIVAGVALLMPSHPGVSLPQTRPSTSASRSSWQGSARWALLAQGWLSPGWSAI